MNVGSLFSGIGGMDAGLARAGHRHVFLCEIDEWRRRVLSERFPGVPIYDDVREVAQGRGWGRSGSVEADGDSADVVQHGSSVSIEPVAPDLLCGGFPCQDLSVAGRRAGLVDGARSSLFFEFVRIADELVPAGGWILIENVPGLLSSNGGRDFAIVLATLAELGFHDLAWRVLDSRFFGVPQRRRRVFIVGRRARGRRAFEVLLEPEGSRGDPAAGSEEGPGTAGASEVSTLTSSKAGGWRVGSDEAAGGQLIAVAATLKGQRGKGGGGIGPEETLVAIDTYNQTVDAEAFQTLRDPHGTFGDALPAVFDTLTSPGRVTVPIDLRQALRGGGATGVGTPGTGIGNDGDPAYTVTETPQGVSSAGVRRLTPVECCRLQGLPDDWFAGVTPCPDSRMYAGLGDAVTANVAEWLGRRILEHEADRLSSVWAG